ncbi:MAG TPA: TPM domain-containing protein [Pirellulales bacterium]|jgi:uncharacterized protein|nr:TPM domain-containing protein [Pirellulales bacterium]
MRSTTGKRTLAALVLLGLLGSASRAPALTAEVRDEAGFFKPETVTQANEVIKEVKQRSKKDLLIETVDHATKGKRQEATSHDPDVRARYFADWADERAREEGVNGIYVLITREPGHVEVAVGNHTRAVFTNKDRHELAQILLSHFRKKEYDEGLLEAVRYVRSALQAEPKQGGAAAPAGPQRSSLPHPPPGSDGSAGGGLWRYLGLGLVVLLGVWLLSAVVRALAGAGAPPARGGYAGPGGPTGYGPAAGGGGFFTSLLGGLFGAAAGSWLYDRFSSGQSPPAAPASAPESAPEDTDYTAEGGDFDRSERSDDDGGGDFDTSDSFDGDDGGDTGVGGGDFGDDDAAGGDF